MSRSCRKNIVQGVFNSVLCYCLPLFGGCNQAELNQLQVQQNRAAQVVLNYPPRNTRNLMFDKLGWMSVLQLISYHTLITVYKIRHSREPEYLANMLAKQNYRGKIIIKNSKLSPYRNSFVFRGAELWNKLPENLRTAGKISSFKKGLRVWVQANVARFSD